MTCPNLSEKRERRVSVGLLACALAWLATLAVPLPAQPDPCLNRVIAVNVLAQNGLLIEGLSAQNFQGKLHGREVEILSAAPFFGPHRVVLVLDASGSMTGVWKDEISAAKNLLSADQYGSFAMITFSAQVAERIDFAQGRQKISDELTSFETPVKSRPYGRTALFDALAAALDLLRPVQFDDAIFLFSDGGENASKSEHPGLARTFVGTGVRVFALIPTGYISRGSRTPDQAAGPGWIPDLVAATGGDSTTFEIGNGPTPAFKPTLTQEATSGFANEIARSYKLVIKLPEALNKQHKWNLQVVDSAGSINRHLRVVYPEQLAACQ